jgi:hypothetical protein
MVRRFNSADYCLTPTFESKSFDPAAEFADRVLGRFKAVSVLTLTDMPVLGLDGTVYEVGLGDSFYWSRFHWWQVPPAEWQLLCTAFQDTLQELEGTTKSPQAVASPVRQIVAHHLPLTYFREWVTSIEFTIQW